MSVDIAAQDFCQTQANFKRKDTVQMIPIVIMAIEDESDRDYITRLFLKNERGMYAMALKIVKEHHTACDMVSEACLKMIEKIGYLREISVQKQTPYILSIVKNTSLSMIRAPVRKPSIYASSIETLVSPALAIAYSASSGRSSVVNFCPSASSASVILASARAYFVPRWNVCPFTVRLP